MRSAAAAFVIVVLAAPAFAQETQQEIAERLYREQEDIRTRSLEKVMSAPARAWDHADRNPYKPVGLDLAPGAESSAAAPPAEAKSSGGGRIPWVLLACLLPVIPLVLLGVATWRRSGREGR